MTLHELHKKDVIQSKTGENLGRVDDLTFDGDTASIESVILHGRSHLFGLLGFDEDLIIPWKCIRNVGTDVIMVDVDVPPSTPRRYRRWLF